MVYWNSSSGCRQKICQPYNQVSHCSPQQSQQQHCCPVSATGPRGATGARGATGIRGPTGATGATGPGIEIAGCDNPIIIAARIALPVVAGPATVVAGDLAGAVITVTPTPAIIPLFDTVDFDFTGVCPGAELLTLQIQPIDLDPLLGVAPTAIAATVTEVAGATATAIVALEADQLFISAVLCCDPLLA